MELKIPNHVGIILDGNGRWAKERNLIRSLGHKAGYENLRKIIKYVFQKDIKVLSIYVFSTENFGRDKEEVDYLMDLFLKAFTLEKNNLIKKNIKVVFSGRDEPLPKKVIDARNKLEEATSKNTGNILNICINYGGRSEIIDACKRIVREGINEKDIDEDLISRYMYQDLPPLDLMIRTSGELRLSNFMLWQNSYAEFYFPKTYFPDFNEEEFDKALIEYTNRDRRYGKIGKK